MLSGFFGLLFARPWDKGDHKPLSQVRVLGGAPSPIALWHSGQGTEILGASHSGPSGEGESHGVSETRNPVITHSSFFTGSQYCVHQWMVFTLDPPLSVEGHPTVLV